MTDPRGPPVPPKRNIDTHGLTTQFQELLRTRRLNDLADRSQRPIESPTPSDYTSIPPRPPSRHASHTPTQPPNTLPAYSSLRNHPKIATAPQDAASFRFCSKLRLHSVRPTKYENPGLLDEALQVIPLDRIYNDAEDEHNLLQAQAASIGGNAKPEWGHQDCVVKALLRYGSQRFISSPAYSDTLITGGSGDHFLLMLITLLARNAACHHLSEVTHLPARTRSLEAPPKSSSINAQMSIVGVTNGSHVTVTCGHCYKPGKDAWANGSIASQCFVVPWPYGPDTFGMRKIYAGLKCIQNITSDGFMLTLARGYGITLGCMPKVRCCT